MKEKKAKIGKKILKGSQKSENHNFESYVEKQLQQNYGTEVSPALWIYQNTDPHSQCFAVSCPARCFQPPTISSTLVCNSKIIFHVCYNVKRGFKAPVEDTTVVTMSALRYILSKKNLKNNRYNCISYAVVVVVQSLCAGALSPVHSFVSSSLQPWTVGQAPLFNGFSRQECWSGLPFPSPGYYPDPGIKPVSPALANGFFTTEPHGKPFISIYIQMCLTESLCHTPEINMTL